MTMVKLSDVSKGLMNPTSKATKAEKGNSDMANKASFASMLQGTCGKAIINVKDDAIKPAISDNRPITTISKEKIKIEKPEKLDPEKVEKAIKDIDEFNKTIVQLVGDILNLTQEQIIQFMETNELQPMDLLQAGNLAQLVSGSDVNADLMNLLNSEVFKELLQQVDVLGKQLLDDSGFSLKELESVALDFNKDAQNTPVLNLSEGNIQQSLLQASTISNEENQKIGLPVEGPVIEKVESLVDPSQNRVLQALGMEDKQMIDGKQQVIVNQLLEDVLPKEINADNLKDGTNQDGSNSKQGLLSEVFEKTETNQDMNADGKGNIFSFNQMLDSVSQPGVNNIQTLESPVDVQEMIDKLGVFTKLSLGNQISTMEMQLNPVNLGKLFITVTSQNGEISARIAAQTQAAKEMIESQVSQFKENMSQTGIKVEAVEVTVSTHEFERNLSGNQSMMNQEQQEQKQPRRRMINGNEFTLDNLQGIMSDEDQILARMMKENGNTMDYQI